MMKAEPLPPDASIASTGLGLRYIGTTPMFVYGYSGQYTANTSKQTLLNSTSGEGFIVCRIQFNGFVHENVPGDGANGMATISFNGINIAVLRSEAGQEDAPYSVYEKFVIPPFTELKVTADADSTSSSYVGSVNLVGRVYEA